MFWDKLCQSSCRSYGISDATLNSTNALFYLYFYYAYYYNNIFHMKYYSPKKINLCCFHTIRLIIMTDSKPIEHLWLKISYRHILKYVVDRPRRWNSGHCISAWPTLKLFTLYLPSDLPCFFFCKMPMTV